MNKKEKTETLLLLNETPIAFSLIIESIVRDRKMSYMDAVLRYCLKNEIDPEYTKALITPYIKGKIEEEARGLRLLRAVA